MWLHPRSLSRRCFRMLRLFVDFVLHDSMCSCVTDGAEAASPDGGAESVRYYGLSRRFSNHHSLATTPITASSSPISAVERYAGHAVAQAWSLILLRPVLLAAALSLFNLAQAQMPVASHVSLCELASFVALSGLTDRYQAVIFHSYFNAAAHHASSWTLA